MGSTAFKAAGTGDPRPAGSIPVHLRHTRTCGAAQVVLAAPAVVVVASTLVSGGAVVVAAAAVVGDPGAVVVVVVAALVAISANACSRAAKRRGIDGARGRDAERQSGTASGHR